MVFAFRAFMIFRVSPELGGTGRSPDAGDEPYTYFFIVVPIETSGCGSLPAKGGETRIIELPTTIGK